MQNLMMGHANIGVFLKYYLLKRITVDTQAVVRGLQPQDALMRAASTMSRTIDPRRPRRLTAEQSVSVNDLPTHRPISARPARSTQTQHQECDQTPEVQALNKETNDERQRQRHALLHIVSDVSSHFFLSIKFGWQRGCVNCIRLGLTIASSWGPSTLVNPLMMTTRRMSSKHGLMST